MTFPGIVVLIVWCAVPTFYALWWLALLVSYFVACCTGDIAKMYKMPPMPKGWME